MTADSMQRASALPYDDRPAPQAKSRWRSWLDWLDSTDPGLMRLRMATEVVVAIGIVVAAEWIFVRVDRRPADADPGAARRRRWRRSCGR